MQDNEIILRCQRIVEEAGCEDYVLNAQNFLDYSDMVKSIILDWSRNKREQPWVKPFSLGLRRLRDTFDQRVAADPMILYKPRHHVALEFHQSLATIRYAHGGNRTSKTVMATWEIWAAVTGNNPFRPIPAAPISAVVMAYDFTNYKRIVFEPKYVYGEPANPLSPAFPEGGKWFYAYRKDAHMIELACKECAEAGKAGRCHHPKSRIFLFSDSQRAGDNDTMAMAGGQFGAVHIDEQIQRKFYTELRERMTTVPNSFMMITETPLKGKQFWTWNIIAKLAMSGVKIPGTDIPIATKHNIDQFSAGLIPHAEILAKMATMTEPEIRARVFGEPMVAVEKAIFDLAVVANMQDEAQDGKKVSLDVEFENDKGERTTIIESKSVEEDILSRFTPDMCIVATDDEASDLTIYEPPMKYTQYAIGVDVSQGLTRRDYSVADVMKMTRMGTQIAVEQVAQFRGWINPLYYAPVLMKLGYFYGGEACPATLVIERNGPGMSLIQKLDDIGCWFMFQDLANQAMINISLASTYGIDTNIRSKSIIIASLQAAIRARKTGRPGITFRSRATLNEIESYIQEPTESGQSFRFQSGAKSKDKSDNFDAGHDDCVMSAAMVTYAIKMFGIYDHSLENLWSSEIQAGSADKDHYSKELWKDLHDDMDKKSHLSHLKTESTLAQEAEDGW